LDTEEEAVTLVEAGLPEDAACFADLLQAVLEAHPDLVAAEEWAHLDQVKVVRDSQDLVAVEEDLAAGEVEEVVVRLEAATGPEAWHLEMAVECLVEVSVAALVSLLMPVVNAEVRLDAVETITVRTQLDSLTTEPLRLDSVDYILTV